MHGEREYGQKLGGIATMLHAEPSVTGSRVLLDLAGPCYRKVFHLVEPYRVVIDIAKHPPGTDPRSSRKISRIVLDPHRAHWQSQSRPSSAGSRR